MKKRRLLAAALAAVMGASLLAGCGGNSTADTAAQTEQAAGTDTAQSTEAVETQETGTQAGESAQVDLSEPVELVWYLVGTPQDDQETVFAEVNKVLKEKLNTTVQFNVIDWGAYDEKMQMIISTNEPYDICFTSDWTNPYTTNAQKDAFYPLTDLLNQYGTHILEQVPESYWEATRVGGELYGVVNYQISARMKGIFFPKDVVEEVGYDISQINSYADLTGYFEAVKEKMPEMVPFVGFGAGSEMPALHTFDTGFSIDYLQGPLGVRAEDPKTAINVIETQEFMDFCKMARDWYEKGYMRKDAATIDGYSEIKTHDYASWTGGVGPGSEITESSNVGFEVVSRQVVPSSLSTGSIQAALSAISINCEHPERAMMVLDYLFEDKETYNMLCYGLEGTHYNQVNDWSIELIDGSGYNPGIQWEYGSWFNAMLLDGQEEDLWDQSKEVNETALASPVLGFVYDSSNVKNETAQISALLDEYLPGLKNGLVDPEEKIPELIEKMNAAGMDKIIEDANAQLAAWN